MCRVDASREYFYETLEAKKKIARANKKKERARDSHMRVARRIVEDAVTRLQTEVRTERSRD